MCSNLRPWSQATLRTVTAAEASQPEPSSGTTAADEKPPVNSWILFVEERYVAEMNRLPAGHRGRKSVMGCVLLLPVRLLTAMSWPPGATGY